MQEMLLKHETFQNLSELYPINKNPQQGRHRRNIPQHNEGHVWHPIANVILNSETLQVFEQERDKDAHAYYFPATLYCKF